MPIVDFDRIRIVDMGHGDVLVMAGVMEGEPHVGTVSFAVGHGTHPINQRFDECVGRPDTELGTRVRLVFTAVESIDVVIGELQKARASMTAHEEVTP